MRDVARNVRSRVRDDSSARDRRRSDVEVGPRLRWPGRTWDVGAVWPASPPLRQEERFGPPSANRLVRGDSLDVARRLQDTGWRGKVDLVYVDPPFASQATYTHEVRLDGPADGRVRRARAYDDSWPTRKGPGQTDPEDGIGAYLDMLAPRLEAMAALLAPTGTTLGPPRLARGLPRARPARRGAREASLRQRDRVAASPQPRSSGRERAVRAHAGHARGLRRSGGAPDSADAPRAHRGLGNPSGRGGAPVHDRAPGRLHRRVHRPPRRRGARAPDGVGEAVRQVLPRTEPGRRAVPRATYRHAVDGRCPAASRPGLRAYGLPDAEAAGSPGANRQVRHPAGRARRRPLRRQRDDRRGGARARSALRPGGPEPRGDQRRARAPAPCGSSLRGRVVRRRRDAHRRGPRGPGDSGIRRVASARAVRPPEQLRIELRRPAEPLAWADRSSGLRTASHSVPPGIPSAAREPRRSQRLVLRSSRALCKPVARMACTLPPRYTEVRVYGDDGSVAVCPLSCGSSRDPPRPRARPRGVRVGGGARGRAPHRRRRRSSACAASASSA